MLTPLTLTELKEIYGHHEALNFLESASQSGHLPPAFCFAGPAGVGKCTIAADFVRADYCEKKPAGRLAACMECPSCRRLKSGNHPDALLITPETSTIKIDEIRDAQHQARLSPVFAKRRWVIINEAEALTEQAQNALLRTLESPPRDTHFILITQALERLLATIRSRCQVVRFHPLSPADVKKVFTALNLPENEHPTLLALSQGCPGRVLEWQDSKILETREKIFNFLLADLARPKRSTATLDALALSKVLAGHKGDKYIILELMKTFFRDLALLHLDVDPGTLVNQDLWTSLDLETKANLKNLPAPGLIDAYRLINQLGQDFKINVNAELSFDRLFQELNGVFHERANQFEQRSGQRPSSGFGNASHPTR